MAIGDLNGCTIINGEVNSVVKTPGVDFGRPLVIVKRRGKHILVSVAGHMTWNGVGRPWRWQPKRYIILYITHDRQASIRKDFDAVVADEYLVDVYGRGRALPAALNRFELLSKTKG